MSDAKSRRVAREGTGADVTVAEGLVPEVVPAIVGPVRPEQVERPPEPVAAPLTVSLPAAPAVEESAEQTVRAPDDAWTAFTEMQAAVARGCEQIALEMTALTRSDIAAASDAATAMLDARTFAEAVEISAGLVRRRADAMIEGTARLSEIGMQAASAASQSLFTRLAAGSGFARS